MDTKTGESIILCGFNGSGKSTAAKKLSELLGMPRVSTGDIFRKHVRERYGDRLALNDALLELGRHYEAHPELDRALDDEVLGHALKEPHVIDGRVSAFLAGQRGIPSLKVWMDVRPLVAAARCARRDGITVAEAEEKNAIRERDIARRLRELYGVDPDDRSYYDLIVDTNRLSADEVVAVIQAAFRRH
jgi:predicted cytidylate kinase